MSEEQTVTEKDDADATPSAEESGAQEKSIDELLSEFDSEPKGKAKSDDKAIKLDEKQRGQILEELRSQVKVEDEIEKSVKEIRGDLDVEDEYVRWKLEEMAKKDERVWKAFVNRNSKPSAWNAIKKELSKELSEKYKKQKSEDKEKLASAVRSATQTAGTSDDFPDLKKMSSNEFHSKKQMLLKQAMKG